MILPEWTTINIVLYTMLAILVLGVAPAELSGWSMMYYSKFRKDSDISGRAGMVFLYFMPIVVLTILAWGYLPNAEDLVGLSHILL